MNWDTKACAAGFAFLTVGIVAIGTAATHLPNPDFTPSGVDALYHRLGVVGFFLVAAGAMTVFSSAVSFSGRLTASCALITGVAFLALPATIWGVSLALGRSTHLWTVVFLVPMGLGILCAMLLIIVGLVRFAAALVADMHS